MPNQERPLRERIWEFTKDLSVKVSKKAEKHWKINTLRVEIASIKHRINVKYKELGRYLFESQKAGALDSESFRSGSQEFFDELHDLEHEVVTREQRIELLELELPPVSYADEVARYRDLPDFEEEEVPPLPAIPNEALERSLAELRAKVQPNATASGASSDVADRLSETADPAAAALAESPSDDERDLPKPAAASDAAAAKTGALAEVVPPPVPRED